MTRSGFHNLIITIAIVSNLSLVDSLRCSITESTSTSTSIEKPKTKDIRTKEKKIIEEVKEADILLPDIAELVGGYAAPNMITLHFPESLTGQINLIYAQSFKDKKILDDIFAQYPQLKQERNIIFSLKNNTILVHLNYFKDRYLNLESIYFWVSYSRELHNIIRIPIAKTFSMVKLPFLWVAISSLVDKEKGRIGYNTTSFKLERENLINKDKTRALIYSISLVNDLKSECKAPGEILITSDNDKKVKFGLCLKQITR